MKIAVGGFQHETNTFAPSLATFSMFEQGGGFPPFVVDADLFDAVDGINLPAAGFIDAFKRSSHTLLPLAWAQASPSAHVTDDAFERITGAIIDGLRRTPPDAVYLDLHGAMVTQTYDDGEGEILRRVRAAVGPNTPIVASLDLHANISQQMLDLADVLIAYRKYPHTDMAETGDRVAHHLKMRIEGLPRLAPKVHRVPFLIPLNAQCTDFNPAAKIYAALATLESSAVKSLSFTPGFPAADIADCGPVVWGYGTDERATEAAVREIRDMVESAAPDWRIDAVPANEAVKNAIRMSAGATKPVVIADTQDNPGVGGNSDTTGLLRALIANNAQRAAIGLMVDPQAAEAAHQAGLGATLSLALGGKSNIPGDAPLDERFIVESLHDGKFTCTGAFFRGARMNLGLSACLRIGGVRIVLASRKCQLADQEMFRYVGIEPTEQAILVNKSSVHFRADFTPIAYAIIVAKAPGPMPADPRDLRWTKLPASMRLSP